MLSLGPARGPARLPRMVAVLEPENPDGRRELVARHLLGSAERVARALHDERRRAQRGEMGGAGSRRLAGGMERVAEADQTGGPGLVGDQARDAPAERLAADHQALPAAEL